MKVWVCVNKRKEFIYFHDKPDKKLNLDTPPGHYERTDTWPGDIDYGLRQYTFVEDGPKGSYWYVLYDDELDLGTKISKTLVPVNVRKLMTFGSEPIYMNIDLK